MNLNFAEYFTLDKLVSVGTFILKPLLILIVCKLLINAIIKVINNILDRTHLDKGIKTFTKSASRIALWVLAIIFIADSLGVNTASLVALLSVVSLALSLSVQNLMTNVFSGITILISKPFVIGDFVEVAGVSGTVKDISIMRTSINTVDNKLELVPNGDIAGNKITNYSTEPQRRVDLKVSASYDAATEDVKAAIMEVIDADKRILRDSGKDPFVRLSGYNSNDIEYTIRVWVNNADYWDVYFDTLEKIRESFTKHKIEFSYPHTMVHMVK